MQSLGTNHAPMTSHWSKKTDLEVARGFLVKEPGASDELGVRLAAIFPALKHFNRIMPLPISESELDDTCSKIYVRIIERLEDYNGRSSLIAWALGYAKNYSHHFYRRAASKAALHRRLQEEKPRIALDPTPAEAHPVVKDMLVQLSDRDRRLLIMRVLQAEQWSAIGQALALSESGAKSRYLRLVKRLREELGSTLNPDFLRRELGITHPEVPSESDDDPDPNNARSTGS